MMYSDILTIREEEVYNLLVNCLNAAQIAKELSISITTVKTHIQNIYSKNQVSSQKELIYKHFKKVLKELQNDNRGK